MGRTAPASTTSSSTPPTATCSAAAASTVGSGRTPHEIGYWLRDDATGRGFVTAAAGALTDAGVALDGIERVEIHCDEANVRSAAVPRRLGYRLDRIEPESITAPGDLGGR